MKYKFLGKPDFMLPNIITGKVYELEVVEKHWNLKDKITGTYHPLIISPFGCPYTSWETFYQNWKPITNSKSKL